MNKGFSFLLIFVMLFSSTACGRARRARIANAVQPTALTVQSAPLPGATGKVLFLDDFQDGRSEGWEISQGWTVSQEGKAYFFGTAVDGAAWIPQGSDWDDTALSLGIRLNAGSLALNYRLSREGRYLLQYTPSGLYLTREAPAGQVTVLAHTTPPPLQTLHNFILAGRGGHLQVYVDRSLWMDVIDPNPVRRGTAGLGAAGSPQAAVDNVRVVQLTGSLPVGGSPHPSLAIPSAPPPVAGPSLAAVAPAGPPAQGVLQPPPAPGPVTVNFTVEDGAAAAIDSGQCVTTAWVVQNALEVYYENQAVGAQGTQDECPTQDTTYNLEVVHPDGSTTIHTVSVTVGGQPEGGGSGQPDLAVTNVTISNSAPGVGEIVTVSATILNQGSAEAGASRVGYYTAADGASFGNPVSVGRVNNLTAGNDTFVESRISLPAAGVYNIRVTVDLDNALAESDEGNNSRDTQVTVGGGGGGGGGNVVDNGEIVGDPAAPTGCTAEPTSSTAIHLKWNYQGQGALDGVRIYQGVTSLEKTAGTGGNGMTIGNLAPGTQYHFDVRTFNAAGESPPDACFVDVTTLP